MKILQVMNKVAYPTTDGGAIACMNLTRGFSHLGHEVTVLSMNTAKHYITLEEIPEKVKDLAAFHLVDVPAQINAFAAFFNLAFSRKPYNAVRFISKSFQTKLKDLLTQNQYDIVQLEGLYVCPYIPIIRKYSNAKIVYRAHNIEHEIWARAAANAHSYMGWYLNLLSKRIRKFEKSWLNQYDLLVPITERDKKILGKMGNYKPAHVSSTGVDSSVMVPNARNLEYPSLFHIGSLEWTPNQEGLIWFLDECWPEILERYPDLIFYIGGRNAPNWLQKKLDRPSVVFLGEVPDAYEFMNSKSIMVVPLHSGSGMRIKVIEGMALGKSIVTTKVGTEGIATTSGENILVADEPEAFVNAVIELVEDEEFFHRVGKNAIEFIHDNFDNLAASSKLLDFYKKHV